MTTANVSLLMVIWVVANPEPPADRDRYRVSNEWVSRSFIVEDDRWRTTRIDSISTGESLVPDDSEEFELLFVDGGHATSLDYRFESADAADDASSLRVVLTPRADQTLPRIEIEYDASPELPILRKELRVVGDRVVDRCVVESLPTGRPVDRGGLGQPIWVGDTWFAGIEHPAGVNSGDAGTVRLAHHPGQSSFTSKRTVWGTGDADGLPQAAFARYLDQIRLPARPILVMNTWFHARGPELTPAECLTAFDRLHDNLLSRFDLSLDAFVVDDGYQEPRSLWQPNRDWPGGFEPLEEHLERSGSHLGLWLPLNGTGLDPAWGRDRGWPTARATKPCYDLTDDRYHAAIKETLARLVTEQNVRCFKHDFNAFDAVSREEPAWYRAEHRREAIADATIDLLAETRKANAEVHQALTSGIWLSPWWLLHAESLWMGYSDFAHDWSHPTSSSRQAEMTFRDGGLYRRLRVERCPIPPGALMTHGIIKGRWDETNEADSLADWSDYVVLYLGRGTLLQELYLSPELLSEDEWNVLGHAIRWARAHSATLANTEMVGGNPARGEAYGFAHWTKDMGILVLRNPSIEPATFLADLERDQDHRESPANWHPVVIYPYQERLPTRSQGDSGWSIDLAGQSVVVVHFYARLPPILEPLPIGRFHRSMGDEDSLVSLQVPRTWQPTRVEEIVDEKNECRVTLSSVTAGEELIMATTPAGGAVVRRSGQWSPVEVVEPPSRQGNWQWSRHRLEKSAPSPVTLKASLPPTPLWPERSRITLVHREHVPLDVVETFSQSSPSERLDWPIPLDAKVWTREFVLASDKELFRGRSLAERLGWFVLLGVAPIAAGHVVARLLAGRFRFGWKAVVHLLVAVGIGLVYLTTPLGVMLWNTLTSGGG